MRRIVIAVAAVAWGVVGLGDMVIAVPPVNTVEWVGGASGEWNDADAWHNITTGVTGDAQTIFGTNRGSEGMNNIDPALTAARHIVIGGGATVDFDPLAILTTFRIRQGTTLTIKDGATWVQDVSDHPNPGLGWGECRCDPSALILDGGTFRRAGEGFDENGNNVGGGNALFGSYNDDNNLPRLGTKPPQINIEIKNGGRLENTGQLWFGTDGESSHRLRTSVTINDGHMDLTGGDTAPIENSDEFIPLVADMVFFYDHRVYNNPAYPDAPSGPLMEEHEINFIGPGSITVDHTGIYVYRQDEFGIWNTGADQVSYQELWDMGILKAHGLSGVSGVTVPSGINDNNRVRVAADFNEFFTVTGNPGDDDYTLTSITPRLQEVEYVGANGGQWSDADAWRNVTTNTTGDAATILGRANGSNGMNTTSLTTTHARNITIPANTTVNYHGNMIGDLRMNQGSTLTIREGGVWQQVTDETFTENAWTQFDGRLILDGGTFRRSGESPAGDGGGVIMFGSYRDDEAFEEIGGPAKINIDIKNGGRLENTGQLWFGADDEHSPGLRVSVNINDGHIDLTGGTIPLTNSTLSVSADLAMFYDYSELLERPKNEEYEINFTGPGSITVDSAGIWVYEQDEFGIWNIGDAGPLSYEDLWDMGILKANGLSGATGEAWSDSDNPRILQPADFSTFFTVSGTPGMDDYTLTSLIEADVVPGLLGDFDGNGSVGNSDLTLLLNNWGDTVPPVPDGWTGAQPTEPAIGNDELTALLNTWGQMAGSGQAAVSAAVPEPTAALLLTAGAMSLLACARRRTAGSRN